MSQAEREAFEAWHQYDLEEESNTKAVMSAVRAKVSPVVFAEIEEYIVESDHTHGYSIVTTPVGKPHDDGYSFGDVLIDQTMNGGYTGDSFAGTVCIPLGQGEFLKFHYSM